MREMLREHDSKVPQTEVRGSRRTSEAYQRTSQSTSRKQLKAQQNEQSQLNRSETSRVNNSTHITSRRNLNTEFSEYDGTISNKVLSVGEHSKSGAVDNRLLNGGSDRSRSVKTITKTVIEEWDEEFPEKATFETSEKKSKAAGRKQAISLYGE